jgi:amidohydrolase
MSISLSKSFVDQLVAFRQTLHRFPELSGAEQQTAARVVAKLQETAPDEIREGLGGHGVLALYSGKEPGPTIMFRAELDALPIKEINTFSYRSEREGWGHKCGHDGHMASLLGLAQLLGEARPQKGTVGVLFQPAEETGQGAPAVLADSRFKSFQPDYSFAYHNLPGFPIGKVIVRNDTFSAAVKSLIVRLKGKTSHAAQPEHGINPSHAIARMLDRAAELQEARYGQDDFFLITPIAIRMGELAYGTSAGEGALHFTLRAWTTDHLEHQASILTQSFADIAVQDGLEVEIEWLHVFPATENDSGAYQKVREAALQNGFSMLDKPRPFRWGEDFGHFTREYPGALFGIGSGLNCPALHNPDYDFPDAILPIAVRMFHTIARNLVG